VFRISSAITVVTTVVLGAALLAGCTASSGASQAANHATPKPAAASLIGAHVTFSSVTPTGPVDIMGAYGSIWVSDHDASSVSRIDPATGKVIATIRVGQHPGNLFVGQGAVWLWALNRLDRISPSTNAVISLPSTWGCGQPAFAGTAIWVWACDAGNYIMKVDPKTGRATRIADGETTYASFFLADKTLWLAEAYPGRLQALDPVTGAVRRKIDLDGCPLFDRVGLVGDALWIGQLDGCLNGDIDVAYKLSPTTGATIAEYHTGIPAPGIVSDGTTIWFYGVNGKIDNFDQSSGRSTLYTNLKTTSVYTTESAYGSLWATSWDDAKLWRIAEH
jgi:YVTN family beta-propeller protein